MAEYFILCANPRCGNYAPVRSRSEQRRRRFCSRHCAGVMTSPLTQAARRKGADASKRSRRQRIAERFTGLTKMQVYRMGFSTGWKVGHRRLEHPDLEARG